MRNINKQRGVTLFELIQGLLGILILFVVYHFIVKYW